MRKLCDVWMSKRENTRYEHRNDVTNELNCIKNLLKCYDEVVCDVFFVSGEDEVKLAFHQDGGGFGVIRTTVDKKTFTKIQKSWYMVETFFNCETEEEFWCD